MKGTKLKKGVVDDIIIKISENIKHCPSISAFIDVLKSSLIPHEIIGGCTFQIQLWLSREDDEPIQEHVLVFVDKELFRQVPQMFKSVVEGISAQHKDVADGVRGCTMLLEGIDILVESCSMDNTCPDGIIFSRNQGREDGQATLQNDNRVKQTFGTSSEYNYWLVQMLVTNNIDHEPLLDTTETARILDSFVNNIISAKHTFVYDNVFTKLRSQKAGQTSQFVELAREDQKEWIEMLMAVPGISETKALSISVEYPTFKSLMKRYIEIIDIEKARSLLEDITVKGKEGNANRRLGKKLSSKVYTAFNSLDPTEKI